MNNPATYPVSIEFELLWPLLSQELKIKLMKEFEIHTSAASCTEFNMLPIEVKRTLINHGVRVLLSLPDRSWMISLDGYV